MDEYDSYFQYRRESLNRLADFPSWLMHGNVGTDGMDEGELSSMLVEKESDERFSMGLENELEDVAYISAGS